VRLAIWPQEGWERGLDKIYAQAKIPEISPNPPLSGRAVGACYDANPAFEFPEKRPSMNQCKHPRVQIVSRDEDSEYVECLECREVFESSEFKDMSIEETKLKEEQ
jgi:hypothetical protein